MISYEIGSCTVERESASVRTTFHDGISLHAVPMTGEADVRRARALGYCGTDDEVLAAMTRDHDVLHTLLAVARGKRWSEALRDAAVGVDTPDCVEAMDEERIVLLIQRLLNVGLDGILDADHRYDSPMATSPPVRG